MTNLTRAGCGWWRLGQGAPMALFAAAVAPLLAQPTVAPTPEAGGGRGINAGGYNVLNSFEIGDRFRAVHGDEDRYRSDVNFGNGLQLLGSSLSINSRDGHGRLADALLLRTQGLGN